MKKISDQRIIEYIYESNESRAVHIALLESQGWQTGGKQKRLKDNVDTMDATVDDYEWYAYFWRVCK